MGNKCELWLFLVVYHIHIHKHPEIYQKMIMQMLMYRLSLELMYQVAHSIDIAVGHFMAFSKRCPESPTCTSSNIEEVAPQPCSLQGFLRGSLHLLKDTDKLVGVGVAVPIGTVETCASRNRR